MACLNALGAAAPPQPRGPRGPAPQTIPFALEIIRDLLGTILA